MAKHHPTQSPPPRTYTSRPPVGAQILTCSRCKRVHHYPLPGSPAIRCECGWWYQNNEGLIEERFKPRLGV